jgi:hypothetical protein
MSRERLSKYRTREFKLCKVQRTKQSDELVKYVKNRFPTFDPVSFYRCDSVK